MGLRESLKERCAVRKCGANSVEPSRGCMGRLRETLRSAGSISFRIYQIAREEDCMWPFGKERRRDERNANAWKGRLRWKTSDVEEALDMQLYDASPSGAQLHLNLTQDGLHQQLFDPGQTAHCELEIFFPKETLRTEVDLCWHRSLDREGGVAVGVKFIGMSDENAAILAKALRNLALR